MTQQELLTYLSAHAIEYQRYEHKPLFTCEDVASVVPLLHMPGVGVKNLFLKDRKKNMYLIVAADTTVIQLKTVAAILGVKDLRFASVDNLRDHLGVEPGSVTPFAVVHDTDHQVEIILDMVLLQQMQIQVHPLNNTATIVVAIADVLKFFALQKKTYRVYDFEHNTFLR